jgi:hypothetical protein
MNACQGRHPHIKNNIDAGKSTQQHTNTNKAQIKKGKKKKKKDDKQKGTHGPTLVFAAVCSCRDIFCLWSQLHHIQLSDAAVHHAKGENTSSCLSWGHSKSVNWASDETGTSGESYLRCNCVIQAQAQMHTKRSH